MEQTEHGPKALFTTTPEANREFRRNVLKERPEGWISTLDAPEVQLFMRDAQGYNDTQLFEVIHNLLFDLESNSDAFARNKLEVLIFGTVARRLERAGERILA